LATGSPGAAAVARSLSDLAEVLLEQLECPEDAERLLAEAIKLAPTRPDLLLHLGRVRELQQHYDAAARTY
jgi:hypothetical protein